MRNVNLFICRFRCVRVFVAQLVRIHIPRAAPHSAAARSANGFNQLVARPQCEYISLTSPSAEMKWAIKLTTGFFYIDSISILIHFNLVGTVLCSVMNPNL